MKAIKGIKPASSGLKKAGKKQKILSDTSAKIKKPAGPTINIKRLLQSKKKKASEPVIFVPHTLNALKVEVVEQGVSELLRIVEERSKEKSELFDSEGQAVFLTVACFRIANVAKRILRFVLPHTLLQETSDVALIVRDLEPRKRKPDNEAVVQLYESRIRAHGIKHPIKVMPIRQVMTEFNTYEAKKQLCNQFDVFLADSHICNRLVPILGKAFSQKRKNPIPVKIESHQMKGSIERALSKSCLKLSADGATFAIQVGHTQQEPWQVAENIVAVVDELCRSFPGGWPNVRNLIVKTSRSPSIPLFVAIRNPNEVQLLPNSFRLRHAAPVIDELSTAVDSKVLVYPSGRVKSITGIDEKKERKEEKKLLAKEKKQLKKKAKKEAKANQTQDVTLLKKNETKKSVSSKERQRLQDGSVGAEEEGSDSGEEEKEDSEAESAAESYESGTEDEEADEAEEAYLTELSHTHQHSKTKRKVEDTKQKQKAKKIKS